jgi:hypothetical protein
VALKRIHGGRPIAAQGGPDQRPGQETPGIKTKEFTAE